MTCLAMLGGRAEACMVCIPFPEDTATDQLLQADVVVLGRENPDQPFSYVAIEVLKGKLDDPDIDQFVDSTTRRRLAFNPGESVVLTFGGATNDWRSAGYATPAYKALAGEILARASTWKQWDQGENRATFFLPYLADADRFVRDLAYLEVGRASYNTIRRADPFVPAAQVHRFLADPQYLEWHALYILLLGVDAKADEKKAIRATMASRAQSNLTLNLSAWATALIEIDGEKAIDWLETVYLGAPDRDPDVVLEIVKALSVQGARKRSGLRRRIAESYGLLIQTHPSLAGWAARDLATWRDWRFAREIAAVRESRLMMDGATAYAIDYYIGEQDRASRTDRQ
jgi:disulfide oxidoreductase YuzD